MALEPTFDYIDNLNPAWPEGTDSPTEGDNHIRGTKNALKGNVSGNGTNTSLKVGGVPRWIVEGVRARFASNQAPAADATLELLGAIAAMLYSEASTTRGGLRLGNAQGTPGPWLTQGDGTATSKMLHVGAIAAAVAGSVGLGFEIDAEGELVATDGDAALGLKGLAIKDLGYGSTAAVRDVAAAEGDKQRPVGFNSLPPITVTGNTTLLPENCGKRVRANGAAAITLDTGLAAALPEDWCVMVTNRGADTVSITHAGGVELYSPIGLQTGTTLTLGVGGAVTLCVAPGDVLEAWGFLVNAA